MEEEKKESVWGPCTLTVRSAPGSAPETRQDGRRRLVTCREVTSKERIRFFSHELLHIDGWTVIAPKGQFDPGQLVVFFEIDSFIPATDGRFWEYMCGSRDVLDGVEGYRVRSITLRGKLSQGIVFAIEEFPEINNVLRHLRSIRTERDARREIFGMSFEDKLGVRKWEIKMSTSPLASLGAVPTFFPQPACERVQNFIGLDRTAHLRYQVTEKLDGVSMSIYTVRAGSAWHRGLPELPDGCGTTMSPPGRRVGVCSRHHDFIDNGKNLYWNVAKEAGLLERMPRIGSNVALQGELCGSSIENNTMEFPKGEHRFFVFAIWDMDKKRYFSPSKTEDVCRRLGILHVPVLGYRRLPRDGGIASTLIKEADGTGLNGCTREGFVFRSTSEDKQFKVISNNWLAKTGK